MFRIIGNLYYISLNSIKYNSNKPRDMLIHHGLMGNAKNFRTISKNKSISQYVNSELIDCRNHGSSPYTQTHTIENLADDIYDFLQERISNKQNKWKKITLMGHSMGAMAIMGFTMKYPQMQKLIQRSILIDIPCTKLQQHDFWNKTGKMLETLLQVNLQQQTAKVYQQIEDRALSKDVANLLKTNIKTISEDQHQWIPNLKVLARDYKVIGRFNLQENQWKSPINVIYGGRSDHVNQKEMKLYSKYYPQMQDNDFHRIEGAGHWVHFDKTKQFLKSVEQILKRDQK